MEIQYQCTESDYQEVLRTLALRTLNQKVLAALIACASIIFLMLLMAILGFTQPTIAKSMLILLPSVLLGYRYVLFPLWVRKDFRRHPNFSRQRILRIDEDGLHNTSEVGNSDTKWLAYTRFGETENLFVLYLGERLLDVVPKRALSRSELDELRGLLDRKILNKKIG
jgi:hypothetical protein